MVPWSEFPNSESAAHLHFPKKLVAKVAHYIIEYISSATERSNRMPSGLNRLLIWASVDRLLSHRSRARLSSTLKRQRQGAASDKWATKTFAQQDIRRGRSRSEAPREKKMGRGQPPAALRGRNHLSPAALEHSSIPVDRGTFETPRTSRTRLITFCLRVTRRRCKRKKYIDKKKEKERKKQVFLSRPLFPCLLFQLGIQVGADVTRAVSLYIFCCFLSNISYSFFYSFGAFSKNVRL